MKLLLILTALTLCGFKARDRVYIDAEHRVIGRIVEVLEPQAEVSGSLSRGSTERQYRVRWLNGARELRSELFDEGELEAVQPKNAERQVKGDRET